MEIEKPNFDDVCADSPTALALEKRVLDIVRNVEVEQLGGGYAHRLLCLMRWLFPKSTRNIVYSPRIRTMDASARLKVWFGYINTKGKPLVCPHCQCKKFTDENAYYVEGDLNEVDVHCEHCKKCVALWAYGEYR